MFPKQSVVWHPKNRKLMQIPMKGLEYAFLTENFEQVHQLVWCKDFLQDAVYAFVNKTKTKIYGFIYEYGKDKPLYSKKTRLMIASWKDKNFKEKIPPCIELIHQIEDRLNIEKSIIYEVELPPPIFRKSGVFILDGSPRWMNSPPMLSFYSLLIRMGLLHKSGDSFENTFKKIKSGDLKSYCNSGDRSQYMSAQKAIDWIFKYGDQELFYSNIQKNYPPNLSVDIVHNSMGLVAYASERPKSRIPHWHRLQTTGI